MEELVISADRKKYLGFKELWRFRELFWALALRDIKVRYKQTLVGVFWAFLQPFIMMVVFTIFFGKLGGVFRGDVPYPLFVFVGLMFWNYFSNAVSSMAGSLTANQAIVQKIYFPRIILPLSTLLVFLIDFGITLLIFAGLLIFYGFMPGTLGLLLILPCLLITSMIASGIGLFLGALNVKYRDVRYILPFFIQMLLFVSPVIYSVSVLDKYYYLWYLNPFSGVVQAMRASLLNNAPVDWMLLGGSAAVSLAFFLAGTFYFRKTEQYFADIV